MRSRGSGETGAIAVLVAVFSVVAFGFAAIVVDLGYARSLKARAQDAADSAALAGAAALFAGGPIPDFPAAVAAAKANANQVMGSTLGWGGCSDPAALFGLEIDCVSFDSVTDPREVRVRVPNVNVSSFFGGVYGYDGTTVTAIAVASLGPVEFTPECAICVLDAGPHVLTDAEVRATDADISFNGDVELLGTSEVQALNRTVFLGGSPIGSSTGFGDALVVGADPIDDPLDGEPQPPNPPPSPGPPRTDPCNPDPAIGGPGVYDTVELAGTCNLEDGTYILTGSLTAALGATITGNEVQFWLQGGSVDLSDAAVVDLDAPTDSSLVYARSGSPDINVFGALSSMSGHINAPGGAVTGGASCAQGRIEGVILVADLNVDNRCLLSTTTTIRTIAPTEPPVLIR